MPSLRCQSAASVRMSTGLHARRAYRGWSRGDSTETQTEACETSVPLKSDLLIRLWNVPVADPAGERDMLSLKNSKGNTPTDR